MSNYMIKQIIRKILYYSVSDYNIISFPKSGRTWIVCFLHEYNALSKKSLNYKPSSPKYLKSNKLLTLFSNDKKTSIFVDHSFEDLDLKYSWIKNFLVKLSLKNKTNFFVLRDPRDTIISFYFHKKFASMMDSEQNILKRGISLSEFIFSPNRGITYLINFLNYFSDHLFVKRSYEILLYENFIDDPKSNFSKLLKSLRLPISEDNLDYLVEETNFENLQKKAEGTDARIKKFRKGKKQNFHEYLNQQEIEKINFIINQKLDKKYLNYFRDNEIIF